MSEQKFHKENWVAYYDAEIDESALENTIDNCYEGELISYDLSGDTLRTRTSSQLYDYVLYDVIVDDETDEELEVELEVDANFSYTAFYDVLFDEIDIEECEEALQDAIKNNESTFEIEVEAEFRSMSNFEVDIEECRADEDLDDETLYNCASNAIEYELSESRYEAHAGDMIQPPKAKTLRFICTIPND